MKREVTDKVNAFGRNPTKEQVYKALEAYMQVHIESEEYDKAWKRIQLAFQKLQHEEMLNLTQSLSAATWRLVYATWAVAAVTAGVAVWVYLAQK